MDLSHQIALESYEEELGQLQYEDLEDELNSLTSRFIPTRYINNKDYNLNAPLIIDDMLFLWMHLKGFSIPSPWITRTRKIHRDIHESEGHQARDPRGLHNWFGSWLQYEAHDVDEGVAFLKTIDKQAEITFSVPRAFFKGVFQEDVSYEYKDSDLLPWAYPYVQKFLDLHKITLCINHATAKEKSNLESQLGYIPLDYLPTEATLAKTKSLGEVIIFSDWVYIKDIHTFVDRNFILMMKDVVVGRMQTLLSMISRNDKKYNKSDILKLVNFYGMGDQALKEKGSEAYTLISLVEPTSLLRISQIADQRRPLIPPFPKFPAFINDQWAERETIFPWASQFKSVLLEENDYEILMVYYGSFRLWGHPFLDYIDGLKKLYDQTHTDKPIDDIYPTLLGSDLARIVLRDNFLKRKSWAVDKDLVSKTDPMYKHIMGNTWPIPDEEREYGDRWHLLPLVKCFDVPEMIDPSTIYSDKSHSMTYSDLKNHLQRYPDQQIPTLKVLETMLEKPATDWPSFLSQVNDVGFSTEDLIIGLRGKEREIKAKGRYFALMSWLLREYFVMTEYLIKTHYVPLFAGLTMADDLNSVIRKMLDSSSGQSKSSYDSITIANHLDYEKWNNYQRRKATNPVFKVMGQFLGYPNLICRTHEIFERSLIYYLGRPDLLDVRDGRITNKYDDLMVCWDGQPGGLEGLRQKGWTILCLLMILRESRIRTTRVKVLAQGDNQVICCQYKLLSTESEEEIRKNVKAICVNNEVILDGVSKGTEKLGLVINQKETLQSPNVLCYGKNILLFGQIRKVDTKSWARNTCVSNDQLPNCGTMIASVSTNALSVAHFALNPIDAIIQYNYFANLVKELLILHDPAIKESLITQVKGADIRTHLRFAISLLYLDPCLGGVTGLSLTRFLVRAFPDPLTESLTFWKIVYHHTDQSSIRELAIEFGNPTLDRYRPEHIKKLLENPTSLNISKGVSVSMVLKEEIKSNLLEHRSHFKNKMVFSIFDALAVGEEALLVWLESITPLFPRFLAEYRSATFYGIADSIMGLYQNSKTIRNLFKGSLSKDIDVLVVVNEQSSLKALGKRNTVERYEIWGCSSAQADLLRFRSWGKRVEGVTIPHPAEMFGFGQVLDADCEGCREPNMRFISVHCPIGLKDVLMERGPIRAYLGSRTSESTSIINPWEKETTIAPIAKAARIRDAISWFVPPQGNIAAAIYANLKSLTGEEWEQDLSEFSRTGSAIHRFSSSRVSNAGYAAQNPAPLTRLVSTTDTLSDLAKKNYDFMYQPSLLYCQMVSSVLLRNSEHSETVHFHVTCNGCVREIGDIFLDSPLQYKPPDVSSVLMKWRPDGTTWSVTRKKIEVRIGDWGRVTPQERSFQVGMTLGFVFGESVLKNQSSAEQGALFPIALKSRLLPRDFLCGILHGVCYAASLQVLHRDAILLKRSPHDAILGSLIYLLEELSKCNPFLTLLHCGPMVYELSRVCHRIPPSYPQSNIDMSLSFRNYMLLELRQGIYIERLRTRKYIWIFSDFRSIDFAGPIGLARIASRIIFSNLGGMSQRDKLLLQDINKISSQMRSKKETGTRIFDQLIEGMAGCSSEIRFAVSDIDYVAPFIVSAESWGPEWFGSITSSLVEYSSVESGKELLDMPPKIQNPLISGVRRLAVPTSAIGKINSLLEGHFIRYRDFLCGGDGSGGITAGLLRRSHTSRGIFNSLIILDGVDLRGSRIAPPSALQTVYDGGNRCVNARDGWDAPSDLRERRTWEYFVKTADQHSLNLDLIVLDMEVGHNKSTLSIEKMCAAHLHRLLRKDGTIIYKTFCTYLKANSSNVLNILGPYFKKVTVNQCQSSSSHTSEVYVVMTGLHDQWQRNQVIWSSVQDLWNSLYAFQSQASEFRRARSLMKENMLSGVPNVFLQETSVMLEELLDHERIPKGVSFRYVTEIQNHPDRLLYWAKGLTYCISEYLCMTHIHYTRDPAPPTNNDIKVLGSMLVGVGMWIALITNNMSLYKSSQSCINYGFPFRWNLSQDEMKMKDGTIKKVSRVSWSVTGGGTVKDVGLRSQLGLIARWIRVLECIRRDTQIGHLRTGNHLDCVRSLSPGVHKNKFGTRTGLDRFYAGQLTKMRILGPSASAGEASESTWAD